MPFHSSSKRAGLGSKPISLRSILRVSMPVSILLLCAGFQYSYIYWIAPVWAYSGLTYKSPNPGLVVVAYLLAALLCAVSPLKFRRPSHAIYWALFFVVYVPGLFVPLFLQLTGELDLLLLQLSLAGGMLLIALSYKVPLITLRRYPIHPRLFWSAFALIYVFSNATLLVIYRNTLHLSSFKEMYTFRYQSGEVLEQNRFVGYISQALANVLNPLLIAYGLSFRRKIYVLVGLLGEILVYAAVVTKTSILSIILIAAFYYTIKKDRGGLVPKLGLFIAGVFFALTTLVVGTKSGILFNIASIGLVRSFAIPGMLMGQYQYFFENQPHTYLGTVKVVNLFVSNPYTLSLGMEIGAFYGVKKSSERGRANENANLFVTDGIAAFGLPGILLAGALCAAVLWVLDTCAQGYSMAFSVSALTMVIFSFTNVSLFTTLLGNGLMTWMLLFIFMPHSFLGANLRAHDSSDVRGQFRDYGS